MSENNRQDLPDDGPPIDPTSEIPYPSTYSGGGTAPIPPPPPSPNPYAAPPASSTPPAPSGSPDETPPPPPPYGAAPDFGQPPTPPPIPSSIPPPADPASPYGAADAPYGTPPPSYYQTQAPQSNTSALVLTILSGIGVFACCAVTIVPLIFGVIALSKQTTEPEKSAKLTKWGWIAFAITMVIVVLVVIAFFAAAVMSPTAGY